MAIDGKTIRNRVSSVCAKAPFRLKVSKTPFSFDLQPQTNIDNVFRIEHETVNVIGGFNFREERDDVMTVWVARRWKGDVDETYQALVTDAASIRAAVIRDGHQTSGEYIVPDEGAGMNIQRDTAQSFGMLRLTIPVNYEVVV